MKNFLRKNGKGGKFALPWFLMLLALGGVFCEARLLMWMFEEPKNLKSEVIAPEPVEYHTAALVREIRMAQSRRQESLWSCESPFAFQIQDKELENLPLLIPPCITLHGIIFSKIQRIALVAVENMSNGMVIWEGKRLSPDLKVVKIREDGVDFQWVGQILHIDRKTR